MTNPTPPLDSYREQLTRWAHALALGQEEAVYDGLADGSLPVQVQMFVDGNREKRYQLLHQLLPFVAGAIVDFDALLDDFVQDQPMAALATGADDADAFLQWLVYQGGLTDEQLDVVACQRARHAVEAAARRNRTGHVRFQEWWSVAGSLAADLGCPDRLRIHLNPIRVWSRFQTRALLDEEASLPAEVLFFAVREGIHTAVLEPAARALLQELASWEPCSLEEWTGRSSHVPPDGLAPYCLRLSQMGVISFT